MDEKQIVVSLGDERVKEIAEVIGSKSCKRILDLLADGDLTVSDVSRELKMPMNTVDYNIKKLLKAGLIEKASHWWSVKGRKMLTYKVSNRKILISPKKRIAKTFAWVIGLTGLSALTLREVMKPVEDAVFNGASGGAKLMAAEFDSVGGAKVTEAAPGFLFGISAWSWFLIGAWFAVFLFFAFSIVSERRRR